MVISPVESETYSAVVALWERTFRNPSRPWNDPKVDLARAQQSSGTEVLVGAEDGRLVAAAMVGHDGHRGWVYYLAVVSDARKRGYGREMMRACEDWLRDRGVPKLNLMVRGENESVRGFYAELGYTEDDVVVLSRRLD